MNTTSFKSQLFPLVIITTLFFVFGFVTNLNGILMPHLQRACELNDFVSAFVPFAFFSAYFLFSIPAGSIILKIGYKNGIVLGLIICVIGSLLFIPAANTRVYLFFLFALAVLASGITLLQVAANPYVTLLGSPEKASSRISLVGTFNSLGGTISPLIGGIFIMSDLNLSDIRVDGLGVMEKLQYLTHEAHSVRIPYFILAVCLLLLAILVYYSKMPNVDIAEKSNIEPTTNILKHRNLTFGIIAIFMYVGAEVSVADFMIRYGNFLSLEDFSDKKGSFFLSGFGLSALVGRFIGIFMLPKIKSNKAIIFSTSFAIALIMISIFSTTYLALWCVMLVGFCNSLLWPTIFPLALEGLGIGTKRGSSYLVMAIVGGAIVPLIFGYYSNIYGTQIAYLVPVLCYLYIFYYGIDGYKARIWRNYNSAK